MNKLDAKKCIYLLASLWTNYPAPKTDADAEPIVDAWLTMLGTVRFEEVRDAILSIAAEGGQFAPQVGEVYAKVKKRREERRQLSGAKADPEYYELIGVYAAVVGVPKPAPADFWTLRDWFKQTQERLSKES